jgi:hypothetical protein
MTSPRDDLVERLTHRKCIVLSDEDQVREYLDRDSILHHAVVAFIEQQAAEIERLRSALNECANVLDILVNPKSPTSSFMAWGQAIAASRRSRAALNAKPEQP